MRALALLSLALAAALCAGCTSPAATGGKVDVQPTPVYKASLANPLPLPLSVTASGAAWVQDGTTLDVSATAPAGASLEWAYGPTAGTAPIQQFMKNTHLIMPGANESITFDELGVFHEHCHPHPWMRSNVTIVDDGRAPQTVTVHFVDGPTLADYHFVPSDLILPKGSTVVYENDGQQPHWTMLLQQDAPLQMLPIKTASGQVTASGNGWMRVVALAWDQSGRVGTAEHDVYVTPTLPAPDVKTFSGSFNESSPGGTPVPVPDTPASSPPDHWTFNATGAGDLALNFTSSDGVASNAPADPAGDQSAITITIATKDGHTVAATPAPADHGTLLGRVAAGEYVITVTPAGGVLVNYKSTLTLTYDLVPPAPRPYQDPSTIVIMQK